MFYFTTLITTLIIVNVFATGPSVVDLGTAGDFAILASAGISTVPPHVLHWTVHSLTSHQEDIASG
jgi:hypothetical protein